MLIAEHGHDYRADLLGDGWNGTMNYAGFLRPAWTWLRGPTSPEGARARVLGHPGRPADAARAALRRHDARVPRRPAWAASSTRGRCVDSHDTARFRTVAGSRERQLVGIGLQMTTPGVPMVFAGDELGLEGDWGEDARRTMPWEQPGDLGRRAARRVPRADRAPPRRRTHSPRGGIRYAHVGADAIAYLRETAASGCSAWRRERRTTRVRLPLAALGARLRDALRRGRAARRGRLPSCRATGRHSISGG